MTTPRITAIRVFRFSRFASLADLQAREVEEDLAMRLLMLPKGKRN